jgi:diacylglycerol kinase (ATP)
MQQIFLVINPSAGQQEPILEHVESVFRNVTPKPEVHVLAEGEQASDVINKKAADADIIAVYGGDGSVTEAAAAVIDTKWSLAIIPGGTANVLAKELGVPQNTVEALEMLRDGTYKVEPMDTGRVNGKPFLLRVNLGVMADMVTRADEELKDRFGQLAYGVSALKTINEAQPVIYKLEIDGRNVEIEGVSLTVTNSGGMGIGGLQMAPGISIDDGSLDVIVLRDASLLSIAGAAGSALLDRESDAVAHWSCRTVKITLPCSQTHLCDDQAQEAAELFIEVVPLSLNVIVPQQS